MPQEAGRPSGRDRMSAGSIRHSPRSLDDLAQALGHRFDDPSGLKGALTHPSVGGVDRRGKDPLPGLAYERLEFLGDRVLGLMIAEWLYERYPEDREGDLAKRLAALVCRETLCQVAQAIGLGDYLRLSPGEAIAGGRRNQTILADACEAVIGALYLDGGPEPVRRFIRDQWRDLIDRPGGPPRDSKTRLQEWAQGGGKPLPQYALVGRTGPAHAPVFEVSVTVEGEAPALGSGKSRRGAEREAAAALLTRLGLPTGHD